MRANVSRGLVVDFVGGEADWMLVLKQICIGVLVGCLLAAGISFWLVTPYAGDFDTKAVGKIRKLCGSRTDCQVRMRDLSPRSFDTYFELPSDVNLPAERVVKILGTDKVKTAGFARTIVLVKGGRMVFNEHAQYNVASALANGIEFRCAQSGSDWTQCGANALLQVARCSAREGSTTTMSAGGTYYVLQQVDERTRVVIAQDPRGLVDCQASE